MRKSWPVAWHIMVVVLGGAIVPLTAVGAWVTYSATQSARDILRTQLESWATSTVDVVASRWGFREGEVLLLASNVVATKAVTRAPLSAADSLYLRALHRQTGGTIPEFVYRDGAGTVVWSAAGVAGVARSGNDSVTIPPAARRPTFSITAPIHDSVGTVVGQMDATIDRESVVPGDSGQFSLPGAVIGLEDRLGTSSIIAMNPAGAAADTGEHTVDGARWLSVARSSADSAIRLIVAAPMAGYVGPFERVSRAGLIAVGAVAIFAILLTSILARRITSPLRQLASAASTIADGELQQTVAERGPREIANVAASFNVMTASLRRTLDELSRRSALAAVGEFAASLAHEVRNGVTSLKVDLQMAEEKIEFGHQGRELVSRSLFSITRLNSTVTGALLVARGGTLAAQPADIVSIVQNAWNRSAGGFQAKSASFAIEGGESPVMIDGDGDALEQLFLNLLLNASQAIAPGGCVRVRITADEDHVTVDIVDDGPGISELDAVRVLEPFVTTRRHGTGLGLPIARQIAIAHRGSLELHGGRGHGTTARIRLPLRGRG